MRLNKVQLIGNLGKDPEVRHLENGRVVANFPLATDESYKDKEGNKVSKAEWHNIVLWDNNANMAEKYLKKGSEAYIEGKVTTEKWQDKDGNDRYTTKIVGFLLQFGSRPAEQAVPQAAPKSQPAAVVDDNGGFDSFPDDLPF